MRQQDDEARFDDLGAGDLDWDALREGKRSAWPIPACGDDASVTAEIIEPVIRRAQADPALRALRSSGPRSCTDRVWLRCATATSSRLLLVRTSGLKTDPAVRMTPDYCCP